MGPECITKPVLEGSDPSGQRLSVVLKRSGMHDNLSVTVR